MKRKIIEIIEAKCTGCGLCIPNCPEGALRVIDGKARLVSDLFCDGLGACIGHCPEGAIRIEEREAERYDEARAMENVARGGANVIRAHLDHLKSHGEEAFLAQALAYLKDNDIPVPPETAPARKEKQEACGCPGARLVELGGDRGGAGAAPGKSRLRQWPVQIMLVPVSAPFFSKADLLIAADCVPFAHAGFHEELLRGKTLLVGCPKFDDGAFYLEKITQILKANDIRSVTVARMEVPCCCGLTKIARDAIRASGREIPLQEAVIGIGGERK